MIHEIKGHLEWSTEEDSFGGKYIDVNYLEIKIGNRKVDVELTPGMNEKLNEYLREELDEIKRFGE